LTRKGRRVHQRLLSASDPFLARLVADYRPEEVEMLLDLLRRIPLVMAANYDVHATVTDADK
jgi:DNA-binding MarR family transcriptional regulator